MKVSDVCDLVNGRAFKPSDWGSYGLPIVRIQNLNNESAPFNYYSGEYNPAHEINDGELLFSWSGTPGTSFGAFRWYRGKGILNQHIYKVVPKINIDKDYLKYALNGNLARIISKAHGGVGLQHITKKELNEITLRIVSNDEQRKIVVLLNQTQNVINARRTQLAKLDELVKCRFVEMFSHTQCPHMEIQNIAEDVFAGGDKPKDIVETRDTLHPYPVFANGEAKRGLQGYSQLCRVDKKAITVSARGTIGYCCIRDAGFTPIVRLITLIPKEHINLTYLSEAIKFIGVGASGAVQAQLTVPDFKKIKIPLPSTNEQNAFAAFVLRIDKLRFVIYKIMGLGGRELFLGTGLVRKW